MTRVMGRQGAGGAIDLQGAHLAIPPPAPFLHLLPTRDVFREKVWLWYIFYTYRTRDPPLPDFDFDEAKSVANLEKHGIDFEEAKRIWLDPNRREVPARGDGELRFAVVGVVDGRHWTAFFTLREERVRLISVRCSRLSEVRRYDHHD